MMRSAELAAFEKSWLITWTMIAVYHAIRAMA